MIPALRRRLLLASLLAFAVARPALADETAGEFIRAFGEETLDLLANQPGTEAERAERLRGLLDRGFDMATVGRAALGPYWRQADETQRTVYLAAFVDFIVATYSVRIRDYNGETFELVGERPLDDKDTLVLTRVHRHNKEPLKIDYRVRTRDGERHIIDVIVEGLSMLTSQRQEFAAVVQREGVDGLIAQLRARADELMPTL